MHYVYLLQSEKDKNWHYIGSCADLKKRFAEHNDGKTRSTKAKAPYKLIYYEAYVNKTTCLKREFELKHNNSKKEDLYRRLF